MWDALRPRAASAPYNLKNSWFLQTRPPRGRKTSLVDAPRIATIHEYLDWTVTAEDALGDNELVRDAAPAVCASSSAGQPPLMQPVQPAHPVTAVQTDTTMQWWILGFGAGAHSVDRWQSVKAMSCPSEGTNEFEGHYITLPTHDHKMIPGLLCRTLEASG